ncbi:MAG: FAD-binding protein, partial [Alphaproteobacteria bacterium]|nr:FAD-binding protein [Alphaproteobacteria bacterium]
VTALEEGARVAILERAPPEDRGGNSRWTDAFMRMKSETEVADDFESHFAENARSHLDPELVAETARDYDSWSGIVRSLSFADPELIASFAEAAGPTLGWLKGFGIRFDFLPSYLLTQSTTRIAPIGGGLALVEALAETAEAKGADFHYRTTAQSLIQGDDGAVVGLTATGARNRTRHFRARGTVLASGGFQGNPEMLAHYLGPNARYLRPVARGGYYNKGEGVRMALALNAAPAGDYSDFHAEPVDPRSGRHEPIVLAFPYGILVNREGQRFVDEASGMVDAIYEEVTRQINRQPGGIAYVVLDAGIDDVAGWQRSVRSDQPPIEADDLGALAEKLEIPSDALADTVARYNAACTEGDFDPFALDGLAASGLVPAKSNWARPLERPPFKAFPIIAANCFTFGGLKTDSEARVLNMDGEVIPGLYAAGETMGLYHNVYTGATSVLRGAVFGRIAGRHASRPSN